MTADAVLLDALLVVAGALLVAVVEAVWLASQLRDARRRVDDLHNRLAARTLAEYAQFSPTAPGRPEPEMPEWVFDETGLIGAEVGDDGTA